MYVKGVGVPEEVHRRGGDIYRHTALTARPSPEPQKNEPLRHAGLP